MVENITNNSKLQIFLKQYTQRKIFNFLIVTLSLSKLIYILIYINNKNKDKKIDNLYFIRFFNAL